MRTELAANWPPTAADDGFRNLRRHRSWESLAAHCRRRSAQLSEREQEFIRNVSARLV